MKFASLLTVALMGSVFVLPALAQPAPFNMAPEGNLVVAPPPETAPAQVPQQPVAPPPPGYDRYILPDAVVRLNGEEAREAMVVYLTQAQAAAPARLRFSYLNAVMVAPEVSSLGVWVNGTEVTTTPISASTAPGEIGIDVPAGLLQAGPNIIAFAASQRHRTDCTVNSTYELWTQLDSSVAQLSFEGQGLQRVQQLSDLAAIGTDATGVTKVRLIAPGLVGTDASNAALMLAQRLALALRVADVTFEWADGLSAGFEPGVLDVVLGTAEQLPAELAMVRDQAAAGAVAALVPVTSGATTLVIAAPDWANVAMATTALIDARPVGPESPRSDLAQPHPMMVGGTSVSLAELGVSSTEFNGRLFSTRFSFDLPPDFYAERYGEAELVLDAAYSSDVLPGSEIDIYSNNQIASATPLLRTDGGQLRDTVIRIPMTNLRAGRNDIDVNVALNAQSDLVCSPGWTGQAPVRFVMSNSTQLRLPDYARAAALPDLRVFTGSSWPYSEDSRVPVVIGEGNQVFVSAMTLLGRMAASSNVVLPVGVIQEAELSPSQNAIIIKPTPAISGPTRERVGLAGAAVAGANDGGALLDRFSGNGEQTGWQAWVDQALAAVRLKREDLRLLPPPDLPYRPANPNAAMLSQVVQPEGGVWTTYAAATTQGMIDGMGQLIQPHFWRQISGRISAVGPGDSDVTVVEANTQRIIETQPFSFTNVRLVAANWFSSNLLAFTGVLILVCALLMFTSSLVLRQLGQNE